MSDETYCQLHGCDPDLVDEDQDEGREFYRCHRCDFEWDEWVS